MKPSRNKSLWALGAIVLGYLVPGILGGSNLVYNTVVVVAIFSVMAYGVDMVWSDLGEVSLAHTVFFATGAYATGILSVRYGASTWLTLPAALLCGALLAVVLGLVTLRTREFIFSLVTYAAAIVCLNVARNWKFLGASDGIVGVPTFSLPLGAFTLAARDNSEIWPYAYGLLILTILLVSRFRLSTLGHSALLVHMNQKLAILSGINPRWVRLKVFVLSAVVSSVAGWLYAYQRAYVGPDLFETYFLVLMLTAVILSGRRVLLGPLIGTALLMSQKAFFSYGGYFDKIVLGAVLVGVLALYPRGLIGLWEAAAAALGRKPRAAGGVEPVPPAQP